MRFCSQLSLDELTQRARPAYNTNCLLPRHKAHSILPKSQQRTIWNTGDGQINYPPEGRIGSLCPSPPDYPHHHHPVPSHQTASYPNSYLIPRQVPQPCPPSSSPPRMTTTYSRPRPDTHCHHSLCPLCTKEAAPDPQLVVSPWYWSCCHCRFRNLALTFHQREVSGTICCSALPPHPEPSKIMSPILRAVASLNMISASWEDMECPIVTRQAKTRARRQTYPLSTSSRSSDSSERIVQIPLIRIQPPGTYALQGQSMEQALSEQTVVLTGQPSVSVPRPSVLTSRRSQPQRGGTSSNGCSHSCQFCLPRVEAKLEWYVCCSCLRLHRHPLMQARSQPEGGGSSSNGCSHSCQFCLPSVEANLEWYFCCSCLHLHPHPLMQGRSSAKKG